MATWALCSSRGGRKPPAPHSPSPRRGLGAAQSPGPRADQAKHFYEAAVPDFRGKALPGRAGSSGRAILSSWMTSGGCCCAEVRLSEAERLPAEPRPRESCSRNTGVLRKYEPPPARGGCAQEQRTEPASVELLTTPKPDEGGRREAAAGRRDGGPGGEVGLDSWGGRRVHAPGPPPGPDAQRHRDEPSAGSPGTTAAREQEHPRFGSPVSAGESSPATAIPQRATCECSPELTAHPHRGTPRRRRDAGIPPIPSTQSPPCAPRVSRAPAGVTGQRRPPALLRGGAAGRSGAAAAGLV